MRAPAQESLPERRKHKRFSLRLPLELVRIGGRRVRLQGETHNLSAGGVLFTLPMGLETGTPVEYFITLPAASSEGQAVRLHCVGKVVGVRPQPAAVDQEAKGGVAIAATLERYQFVRSRGRE